LFPLVRDLLLIFTRSISSDKDDNKEEEVARFTTPSPSPKAERRGLTSPKKIQHIPMTPHRPSMDEFWNQEVVNDWNDEHSPRKAPKSQPKKPSSDDQSKVMAAQARLDRAAKKEFNAQKDKLARDFLFELDNKLTGGQISKMAGNTGGVQIVWSKTLNTTAGQALWKGLKIDDHDDVQDLVHQATIELAEKVITDKHRLLNVVAHEFCHLCTIMIDDVRKRAHGRVFQGWASKCTSHFSDRGVKVTTKHNYVIDYKFVWECTSCGVIYERHSKSIDPTRLGCGGCGSKLVQIRPKPKPATASKPNNYRIYLKENMNRIKDENPGRTQKEIMSLVGQEYREAKAQSLGGGKSKHKIEWDTVLDENAQHSQEDTPEAEDDYMESTSESELPAWSKR
jgi:predicted SprT family Zn-dependent metalloprotease